MLSEEYWTCGAFRSASHMPATCAEGGLYSSHSTIYCTLGRNSIFVYCTLGRYSIFIHLRNTVFYMHTNLAETEFVYMYSWERLL